MKFLDRINIPIMEYFCSIKSTDWTNCWTYWAKLIIHSIKIKTGCAEQSWWRQITRRTYFVQGKERLGAWLCVALCTTMTTTALLRALRLKRRIINYFNYCGGKKCDWSGESPIFVHMALSSLKRWSESTLLFRFLCFLTIIRCAGM